MQGVLIRQRHCAGLPLSREPFCCAVSVHHRLAAKDRLKIKDLYCNHGAGPAVLHPVYYRHIFRDGLKKFKKFAENVWRIFMEGKTDGEIVQCFLYQAMIYKKQQMYNFK